MLETKDIRYNSGSFTDLIQKIKSGNKVLKLSGLKESSRFYLISTLAEKTGRTVLYVVPSRKSGEAAAENISFYSGEKPPLLLRKELNVRDVLSSAETEGPDRVGWLQLAKEKKILVAEAPALFEKRIPRDVFENSVIELYKGSLITRDELLSKLIEMGYICSDFVENAGEISLRGGIVDVFAPGAENPVRLELLGDEVNSIRYFSIEDQKSTERVDSVAILPVSEVILTDETIKNSVSYIRQKAGEKEIPASAKLSLIEEIEKGNRFPQIEWLIPSFYPKLDTAFDYLPADTLIVFDAPEEIANSIETFINPLDETQTLLKKHLKIVPDAEELYLTKDQVENEFSKSQRIIIEDIEIAEEGLERINFDTERISVRNEEDSDSPFDALFENIGEWQSLGFRVLIVLQTEVERQKIKNIFAGRGIKDVEIQTGGVSSGFIFPEGKIAVVTEKEIFGERKRIKPHKVKDIPSAFITTFSELKPGDYIVHTEFGIGIFRGLKRLKLGSVEGDFIQCEYQGGDKIYVPVDKLRLVGRYVGSKSPKIDKLGHANWKRVVKRVKRAAENIAKDLVKLYAERKSQRGFQFSKRDKLYKKFEFSFPYEETPDQEAAIEDVMRDMETPRPMDRLICGDAGFGKTEVALRAAFKAVMDGKQVAFLVPTTLLAYQHFLTCGERLKGYPVFVEMLSRFRSEKQQKEIFKKLEDGTIDIVVGTHKLLGSKVKFKDLGLVIIDEEHRFGVAAKEKLRNLKKTVDVLTLSATPIPRTLQLSLTGIRDISLINTPPEGREAIETRVFQFNRDIIRDAITKELKRGGAVFFIHNRIENIYRIAEEVRDLVPEARIDVTHGRMKESDLENGIFKFIGGETDVLVTTAIVEAGLDIPSANTLIINDAHTFGLADLYQLRGRVGRSEKKAYAYLLIPNLSSLNPEAKRRLKAISEIKDLGSGFKLALSDLEIRGAGNMFGTEQSGHIGDVGLELYLEMLDKAVRELKGEEIQSEYEPEIKVSLPAFIPDDYIYNEAERLLFYKKVSAAESEDEIREIGDELGDRFGSIPEPVSNLLKVVELKLLMKNLLIEKLDLGEQEAVITFLPKSPFYSRFAPSGKYRITCANGEAPRIVGERLKELTTRRGVSSLYASR